MSVEGRGLSAMEAQAGTWPCALIAEDARLAGVR